MKRPTGRRHHGAAFAIVVACLYLPFAWLLLIDDPWDGYRFFWLRLWPVLPGFLPGAWLFHPHDAPEFAMMGATSLLALVGLTWLGSAGRRRLAAATVLALLVSVPSSVVAYAFFRA